MTFNRLKQEVRDTGELVVTCAGQYATLARAAAARNKERFEDAVMCLTTKDKGDAGLTTTMHERMDIVAKNDLAKLTKKHTGMSVACTRLMASGITSKSTVLIVLPCSNPSEIRRAVSILGVFAIVLVEPGSEVAKMAVSWDISTVYGLHLPHIMDRLGAAVQTRMSGLFATLQTSREATERIVKSLNLKFHFASQSLGIGQANGFAAPRVFRFLRAPPERRSTHSNEFYFLVCLDFTFAVYYYFPYFENEIEKRVRGNQAHAESDWVEVVDESAMIVHMKRSKVVCGDRRDRTRVMSAVLLRVQTCRPVASPSLLRAVIDAVDDTFGHDMADAKAVLFLLFYITNTVQNLVDESMMSLGAKHMMTEVMELYHAADAPVKRALIETASSVSGDLKSAFASFGRIGLFQFVYGGDIDKERLVKLMRQLIADGGDAAAMWKTCGLLATLDDGTLPLYEAKLSCSFCNTLASGLEDLQSFVSCYNPDCVSGTGNPRGAICRSCFSLYKHPLCLKCATSRCCVETFHEFMSACKDDRHRLLSEKERCVQLFEQERATASVVNQLFVHELRCVDADICFNELVCAVDTKQTASQKRKNRKKNRHTPTPTTDASSEVAAAEKEETAGEVNEAAKEEDEKDVATKEETAVEVDDVAAEEQSEKRHEDALAAARVELTHLRIEKETREEAHARQMCAAEQKIRDLYDRLAVAEVAVVEVAAADTAQALDVQSILRRKLELRTDQFVAMAIVAARPSTIPAAPPSDKDGGDLSIANTRLEECERLVESLRSENATLHAAQIQNKKKIEELMASSSVIARRHDMCTYHKGAQIITQIEYYFGYGHYEHDRYLLSLADRYGWVPIKAIVAFNRLKQLRADTYDIELLLNSSMVVQVKPGHLRQRRNW